MSNRLLIFLLLIFCASIYPQEWNRTRLDSLYNIYVTRYNYIRTNQPQYQQEDTLHTKCGFGISADIFLHFNEFTKPQQKILKVLDERPVTDASIVSPSGFFRVHYYSTGAYVPRYDINEFAKALDSSYNFEVNYLGYPPPPSDTQPGIPPDSVGGDNRYDVYIINLSDYGVTMFETSLGGNRFTSYIQVHYSFEGSGFSTHGINAARVTAAHEFHHAIQVGNYLYRDSDRFFYELTSTSMEEFVFNSVNDYYGYMGSYFSHPDKAFSSYAGYELAIWNIFLKNVYGYDIIKRQWELMVSKRAIDAINTSLLERHSSFGKELNTFGIWVLFTNYRAIQGKYFPEALYYPKIYLDTLDLNNSLNLFSVKPTSNNYLVTVDAGSQDSLYTILTNTDYVSGIDSLNKNFNASYTIYNFDYAGSIKLNTTYYELLSVNDLTLWLTAVVLNGRIIKQDTTIYQQAMMYLDYAYPNPFRYNYSSTNTINIPVKAPYYSKINLYIYSSSMDLIFSKELPVTFGKDNAPIVAWNLDEVGKKIGSGIYIYVAQADNGKTVGKLVIFNE